MTAPLHEFYRQALAQLESDQQWLGKTAPIAVGASTPINDDIPLWENLGFAPHPDDPTQATRQARLDTTFSSVPAECEELSHIDCVTMSTIERRTSDKQYVYDTLRSVFATFPVGVQVNLAVGDDRTEFVSRKRLHAELGPLHAEQVHVWAASPAQTAHLKDFKVARRAAWNYARAIRSYQGSTGLLLMEDDVQWAAGGINRFDYWLAGHRLPVISLYNYQGPPFPDDRRFTLADLVTTHINEPRHIFDCTQAMYIAAPVTRALGDFILLRAHLRPYDLLLDTFCASHRLSIGHTYPSLVQHIGEHTNGLGRFHQSNCFVPSLMRREIDQ